MNDKLKDFKFKVRIIKFSPDYKMPSHIHDLLEIVYVLEGKGSYFVVDRVVNLEKGDILVINNKEIHRSRITKKLPFAIINLHFNKELIENVNIDKKFDPVGLFFKRYKNFNHKIKLTDNSRIDAELLLKKMLTEYNVPAEVNPENCHYTITSIKESSQISIKLHLLELLNIIKKSFHLQTNKSSDKKEEYVSSEAERVVKEIVEYINNNITKKLTLNYLAKQAIFSPYYFSRIFKDVTGFSIREYINHKRIILAKELLQKESIRIIDVCYEVGYENLSYFNFIFKKLVGVSPFKYRKISK
ncbi:MAG: AraC family transcriptional regulator [Candidatus Firestonebacteria bacterium]